MKPKNAPVGEVECPQKGCTEIAKVFRFRPRGAAGRKTVFTGKHYLECPKHGRIGADGNPTINEYVLENAKLWEPKAGPAPSADGSRKNPPAEPPATATEPAQKPSSASRWRPLLDLE